MKIAICIIVPFALAALVLVSPLLFLYYITDLVLKLNGYSRSRNQSGKFATEEETFRAKNKLADAYISNRGKLSVVSVPGKRYDLTTIIKKYNGFKGKVTA